MGSKQINKVYWAGDYMISSLGVGTEHNALKICNYDTGIDCIDDDNIWPEEFYAGKIRIDELCCNEDITRLESLMILSITELYKSLSNKDLLPDITSLDTAFIVSTTKGNIDILSTENVYDERLYLQNLAASVARKVGIKSKPIVISNACISGVSALIIASRLIQEGKYKNAIVVGGDLLTKFVVSGFQSFKSVTKQKICRPYDESRDGLSMGEAIGAVFLTSDEKSKGDKPILICGGAITNDANHISGPSRTGDGLYYAIEAALREAGAKNDDIRFISAHGTATLYNDEMESKALNLSGLLDVPVNSMKPYFGHTLGACGVIESILCVWQLRNIVFGTKGFKKLGVPYPVNVSAEHGVDNNKPCCLKIASGFGGCNAAMILSTQDIDCNINFKKGSLVSLRSVALKSDVPFPEYIREQYKMLASANMKFFKMDDQCKLGYIASEKLLQGVDLGDDRTRIAIIMSNKSSSLDTDLRHQKLLNSEQPASPAVFVYTLPNIVCGEIAIRHKIQGENTFFVQENRNGFAREYAEQILKRGDADYVIFGWCDLLGTKYDANFELLTLQ